MSALAAVPQSSVHASLLVARAVAPPTSRPTAVDSLARVSGTSDARLPPPSAPRTPMASAKANSFVQSVAALDLEHMNIDALGEGSLTAAFLKLNITDPNNNVETHDALYTAASNLRQLALDEAKKENDRFEELSKEATKYAETASIVNKVVGLASVVAAATSIAAPCASAVIGGGLALVAAMMDNKQTRMQLAVREASNAVARTQTRADEAQTVVQSEGDIVNDIMQVKNDVVDAVMKMIEQRGMSQQVLMAAAMAR